MQSRIGRASIAASKKSKTLIPRDTCCICRMIFATHDTTRVLYVHHTGDHIALCYGHLMEITNRPGTWCPRLSLKKSKDFDLIAYLNDVRTIALSRPLSDARTSNTFSLITELLDKTQLSRYIGGTSELFNNGLKPTKPLDNLDNTVLITL